MTFLYSKITGACYLADTEYADEPTDLVEISDELYDSVFRNPDPTKIRSNDANGLPTLVDPPAPTPDELAATALAKRDDLLAVATARLAPLQDAVDLGEATDEETAQLTLWKKYRVALNRIQTQTGYPTTIDWPEAPAQ